MRIIISFKCLNNYEYIHSYYQIQGFIYKIFKETGLDDIHDKGKTKFFTFSNIFPIDDFKIDENKTLIISSPENKFIYHIKDYLEHNIEEPVKIGNYYLILENYRITTPQIKPGDTIQTSTPIIIRLNDQNGNEFWQPSKHKAELFLKQLKVNLIKKYNLYYDNKSRMKDFDIHEVFDKIEFKKTVINHIRMDRKEFTVLGNNWKFKLSDNISGNTLNLLNFSFEIGFGEMNSMGYGFMNLVSQ